MTIINKKITVINHCGYVGKTMITTNLLATFMPEDTTLIGIHPTSINRNPSSFSQFGLNFRGIRGKDAIRLIEELVLLDNSITDVSSAATEEFFLSLNQLCWEGIEEDFDFFVVPTLPDSVKAANDTIYTIKMLHNYGVSAGKIKVVLNNFLGNPLEIEKYYQDLFDFYEKNKIFMLDENAFISKNSIYDSLCRNDLNIKIIQNDNNIYQDSSKKDVYLNLKNCFEIISK